LIIPPITGHWVWSAASEVPEKIKRDKQTAKAETIKTFLQSAIREFLLLKEYASGVKELHRALTSAMITPKIESPQDPFTTAGKGDPLYSG
jgi:hypothetical protein